MLIEIPNLLPPEEVQQIRRALEDADWADGSVTAGFQSRRAKHNEQLPEESPVARAIGDRIVEALSSNALFVSAALPLRVFPPLFNRYHSGQSFGTHVDNAVRQIPGTPHRIRTDLSATLFFSSPEEYEGGELVIEDTYGLHTAKLPAGHLVLYPSSSLHHVRPVNRGARICAFFWIQSMVRDDGHRTLLFDLDEAARGLHRDVPDHPSTVQLTGVYHNLLRRWAEM